MPSSIGGATADPASAPSAPSVSPTSLPSNDPCWRQRAKLNLADQGRLMLDNSRVLDESLRRQRLATDQTVQLRAQQAEAAGFPASVSAEDAATRGRGDAETETVGNINIDSPVTHNHYYGAAPTPAAPPAPSPIATPAAVSATAAVPPSAPGFDRVTEQQQADGSWRVIRRERLQPDGTWVVL